MAACCHVYNDVYFFNVGQDVCECAYMIDACVQVCARE